MHFFRWRREVFGTSALFAPWTVACMNSLAVFGSIRVMTTLRSASDLAVEVVCWCVRAR